MKWKLKALILRQLSWLPFGQKGYLSLQKLAGTTRVQPRRDLQRASELIQLIHESGQTVKQTDCYEIGTGWHPFTPLGFYLAGARSMKTVDVNPWLSFSSALKALKSAEPHLTWFAEAAGLRAEDVRERYWKINFFARNLKDLLASINCEYQYPADARATGLPAQQFDFVVSSNVLEHVPPQVLKEITQESLRILKPGGLFVHRFNPGDHYANDDSAVSTVHFLQFSETECKKYGSGLAYHNRLRCSDYQKIFAETGLLALVERTRLEPEGLAAIQSGQVKPHGDFSGYALEDLASDYMWYVGMKGTAVEKSAAGEKSTVRSAPVKRQNQTTAVEST